MKRKILSVFVVVAMLLSLVTVMVPQVHAATEPTSVQLSGESATAIEFYNLKPDFNTAGQLNTASNTYVYKMDDTIKGTLNGVPTNQWKVSLVKVDGTVVYSLTMPGGSNQFSILADEVQQDGEYRIYVSSPTNEFPAFYSPFFFIQYDVKLDSSTIGTQGSYTITGWVSRGKDPNGNYSIAPTVPVTVYLAYPDNTLAGYSTIASNTSGQFAISVAPQNRIGNYRLYISDGYDTSNTDHDAMVYAIMSNIPPTTLVFKRAINDAPLYANLSGQNVLLHLTDQNGHPITGATITATTNSGIVVPITVQEEQGGYYHVVVDTSVDPYGQVIVFRANATVYTEPRVAYLSVPLVKMGEFNPYIDVNVEPSATYSTLIGRDVYDKLPCSIGFGFVFRAGVYNPVDAANYHVHDVKIDVQGPVKVLDGTLDADGNYIAGNTYHLFVTDAGQISVTISANIWERVNKDSCPPWNVLSEDEMSTNACCHEFTQTYNLCKAEGCGVQGIILSNSNSDTKSINVGDTTDVTVNISPNNKNDIDCGCTGHILHMYMVDNNGNKIDDAFTFATIDPYIPTEKTSDIWINPMNDTSTNIDDEPITLEPTTPLLNVENGCSDIIFKGITFNVSNTNGNHLIIEIFGTERVWDSNTNTTINKHPFVYEAIDPFAIVSGSDNIINSDATIVENGQSVSSILAGTIPIIEIKDPGFAGNDTTWIGKINGKSVPLTFADSNGVFMITLVHALSKSGTLTLIGKGTDAQDNTKIDEVHVSIPVVVPTFTIKETLADGTTIDGDGISTEGVFETITVVPTDPRGVVDFTKDTEWTLSASPVYTDCGIPTSFLCYNLVNGCNAQQAISVAPFANPNLSKDIKPQFNVYMDDNGAHIKVATFNVVEPDITITITDKDGNVLKNAIVTVPPVLTHIAFKVTDAHKHPIPGVTIGISLGQTSATAGEIVSYSPVLYSVQTDENGEASWLYSFTVSGRYAAQVEPTVQCELPCGWDTNIFSKKTFDAVYVAPKPDTEAPVITITAPKDGATVDTDTVTVKGTVTDNVGVNSLYVNAQKIDFAPDGSFSTTVSLTEGKNIIKVFAFDAAGNKAEKDITVTYAPLKKTVVTVQIGSDVMTVNGEVEQLDVVPVIHNGHTYLPLRAIAEALGAKVDWIAATKGITLKLGNNTVGLQIGNSTAVINGSKMVTIYPPYLQPYGDGTYAATMVPLRVIAEGLGATVGWDPATRVVTITLVHP